MPAQCIWFFDIVINVTQVVSITIQRAEDGHGVLVVALPIAKEAAIDLPVPYDEALTQWRALMAPKPHTHDAGTAHSHEHVEVERVGQAEHA